MLRRRRRRKVEKGEKAPGIAYMYVNANLN
jgi:hypothetical protein